MKKSFVTGLRESWGQPIPKTIRGGALGTLPNEIAFTERILSVKTPSNHHAKAIELGGGWIGS